jgi:hypothetical protein
MGSVPEAATGAGRVRLESAEAKEYSHSFAAQGLDAVAEWERLASAELTNGSTMIGTSWPVICASTAGRSASERPGAGRS